METLFGAVLIGIGTAITVLSSVVAYLYREQQKIQIEHLHCREELIRVKEELRDPRFHNEAIIIINNDSKVVGWNLAAIAMFGWSLEEIINKPVTFLMPLRFIEKYQEISLENINKIPNRGPLRVYGKRKDGTEIPIEITLSGYRIKTEIFRMAYISTRISGDSNEWNPSGSDERKIYA